MGEFIFLKKCFIQMLHSRDIELSISNSTHDRFAYSLVT